MSPSNSTLDGGFNWIWVGGDVLQSPLKICHCIKLLRAYNLGTVDNWLDTCASQIAY